MAVIRPRIDTDPEAISQIGLDYLTSGVIEGWQPAEGDLVTWTIRAHARMIAEERDVADDVPFEQIIRPLGEKIHRLAPTVATAASVAATITVRDEAGYTIPAGLEVFVRTAGDDGVTMLTVAPVTIARGGTTTQPAEVTLRAAPGREGTSGNGLSSVNEAVPLRALDYIDTITLASISDGGADTESDDEYLERLVRHLALTSPVPILPDDFASIAKVEGTVGRALAMNLTQSTPEVITLDLASAVGTVSVTDLASGRTMALLTNSAPAAVKTVFESQALTPRYAATVTGANIGRGSVVITLSGRETYGPWRVVAASGSVGFTLNQQGGTRMPIGRAVALAVTDVNGEPLPEIAKTAVRALIDERREVNWITSVIDPAYSEIAVDFTAVAWPGEDPVAVRDAAVEALRRYLSPGRWGTPPMGDPDGWIDEPKVRYLELAQVLNEVPGMRYVTSLSIGIEDGERNPSDLEMPGPASLPRAGSIRGSVEEG